MYGLNICFNNPREISNVRYLVYFYLSKSISATVISDFQVTFKLSPKSRLGSHAH